MIAAASLGLTFPVSAQTSAPPPPRPSQASPDAEALAGTPPTLPERNGGPQPPMLVAPSGAAAEALAQAVLTVDQEAIYRESEWGRRAEREIAEQSRQVAADNDKAFAELVTDEDALTAARATLDPEEFKRRAAAFDARVTVVRQERDAALADLSRMIERDKHLFFQAAAPVLGRIMTSRNALVVLDQRTVLISAETVDVTAATVEALNSSLGDGSEIVAAAIAAEKAAAEAAPDAPEPEPSR